ncbi:MAG: ATP-dependent RecD-like DNA helicase [Verrucomicrobia bacterium]|nr:ATP-dependent RecD-like DNA helicase [Verrucomicrobiota bacterium]
MRPMNEPIETISGSIERIVYSNEENHYTVAALLPEGRGRQEPVTIVGNLAALNVGESVRAQGHWIHHKQFGRQFAVVKFESVLPRTVVGIKKYLGSGLVKGIGEKFAERIVEKFGEKTFEVIDSFSARLREVEGIGAERARRIKEAWIQQQAVRDIMIFLQGHGIGSAHAAKIYKQYGERAVVVVRENPFRLAKDIAGIGFKTADGIASKLGIAADSVHRLKAGVIHALEQATDDGHCCLPHGTLAETAAQLLGVELRPVEEAIRLLAGTADIVIEEDSVYLAGLHRAECGVAVKIRALLAARTLLPPIDLDRATAWVQQKTGIELADAQEEAVRMALTSTISVITGGPGVGKTTIVNSIVQILRAKNCHVLLAAPTGRAAKRMTETTGAAAQTIHRLLRYDPREGGFSMNERRPLKADVLIIDEASMLDIPLAYHLLKAVPAGASVVFVGDVDQLPSVGPGNFLRDLIESRIMPVARLTEIFRQAKNSFIITNAHRVNEGQMPVCDATEESDFFFIQQDDPEKALATVRTLCAERVPSRFRFDPMRDIQVLTPMHKGVCGSENLNRELAASLNPTGPHVQRFGRTLRVGDRVMQIRNNYDKDVFNGDLGRVKRIDLVDQQLVAEMDDREVAYEFEELDELAPAYAISVHKSQGNEYPCVIVPLLTQHFVLLQRNLLYTAITRGRKLVILVGSKKALAIAIRNNRTASRHSLLCRRLRQANSL